MIDLRPNCVAQYLMNDNKDDNVVVDTMGNYNGVYIGTGGADDYTSAHSVAGKVNTALNLDGVNDHILVADEGALEFGPDTQDFSIAILFKRAALIVYYLLCKRDAAGNGWGVAFQVNRFKLLLNGKTVQSGIIAADTDWHLLIVVVNRTGNAQMYIDNVATGNPVDVSGETMNITDPLHFGEYFSGIQRFNGIIDVTTFFNIALSQLQMNFIWQNGRGTNALHEVYPGFTSFITKPRVEAVLTGYPRMEGILSCKPRMEGLLTP